MPVNKKTEISQRNDTNFLRALAIILIINSHMDLFYPVKDLATGGMIGNSIFFMLSSIGLYLSWQKNPQYNFNVWFLRRIRRIYPSVWITIIAISLPILICTDKFIVSNILQYVGMFFYPPFWFLQALLIYYFIIYFVLKNYSRKVLIILFITVIIFYFICYIYFLELAVFSIEKMPFRIIFYFLVFLWGLYLGSIKDRLFFGGVWDVLFAVLSLTGIYAHKFFMYQGMFFSVQIIQHIAVFPLLFYLLKIAKSEFISKSVMNSKFPGNLINVTSMLTLELFIVNNSIDLFVSRFKLGFPYNTCIFLLLSVMGAILINLLSKQIRRIFFAKNITL